MTTTRHTHVRWLLSIGLAVLAALAAGSSWLVAGASPPARDHGLIAFTRADGIYVIRADGTGVRPLRRGGVAAGALGLAWSPDGSRLAFTTRTRGGIWVMTADGSGLVRVVASRDASLRSLGPPTWVTSRSLAFTAIRDVGDIWMVDTDGRNLRRVARTPQLEVDVDWSPTGDRVAFADVGGYFYKLYVMNADGSGIRRLAPPKLARGETFQAATPAWAPDGRRIAFTRLQGSPADASIWTVDRTGRPLRQVTRDGTYDRTPDWSADGRRIVFVRGGSELALDAPPAEESSGEIYTVQVDGTGLKRLTHNRLGEGSPAWQPIAPP